MPIHDGDGISLLARFCERQHIDTRASVKAADGPIAWIEQSDPRAAIEQFVKALRQGLCPVLLARSHTVDSELRERAAEQVRAERTDTPVFGCLSSGSSGRRRLHLFDLERAFANARMHADSLEMDAASVIIQALPLEHLFGLVCYLFTPALLGCDVEFQSDRFRWALAPARDLNGKRAVLHLVPAQLRILEQSAWSGSRLAVTVGTDRAPKESLRRLNSRFPKIFVTYGLTEAGPRVATGLWNEDRPEGWIGEIFPEIAFRFDQRDGENTTLHLRSPSLSLTAELGEDGYLDTRDVMEPFGRGGIFLRRLGHRFKWRGRLYSQDEIQAVAREFALRQRATLCVLEDSRLAILTEAPLEPDWRRVFSRLDLPFPEHFQLAAMPNGKLDVTEALKSNKLLSADAKLIYF